eukprot:2764141-Amphidinium_carterae.1
MSGVLTSVFVEKVNEARDIAGTGKESLVIVRSEVCQNLKPHPLRNVGWAGNSGRIFLLSLIPWMLTI